MKERILKRGFELLKTRPVNEEINLEILERKYGVKLPPKYTFFVNTFEVGKSNNDIAYETINNVKQYCAGVSYFSDNISDEEVMFANFQTVESTISNYDADDDWLENGYLPIGTCGHGGSILLGTKGTTSDCVFLEDNTQEVIKLNENIFDFVRSLVLLSIPQEELIENIKYNQLYKNWGEDFWRIKKDENSIPS